VAIDSPPQGASEPNVPEGMPRRI